MRLFSSTLLLIAGTACMQLKGAVSAVARINARDTTPQPPRTTSGPALATLHPRATTTSRGYDTCAYVGGSPDNPLTCDGDWTCSSTVIGDSTVPGCCGSGYSGGTGWACGFYTLCLDSSLVDRLSSTYLATYLNDPRALICTDAFAPECENIYFPLNKDYVWFTCSNDRSSQITAYTKPFATNSESVVSVSMTSVVTSPSPSSTLSLLSTTTSSIPSVTSTTSDLTEPSAHNKTGVIVGSVAGGLAELLALFGAIMFLRRKRKLKVATEPAVASFRVLASNLHSAAVQGPIMESMGGKASPKPTTLLSQPGHNSGIGSLHGAARPLSELSSSEPPAPIVGPWSRNASHVELPSQNAHDDTLLRYNHGSAASGHAQHTSITSFLETQDPSQPKIVGSPTLGHVRSISELSVMDSEDLNVKLSSRSGPISDW